MKTSTLIWIVGIVFIILIHMSGEEEKKVAVPWTIGGTTAALVPITVGAIGATAIASRKAKEKEKGITAAQAKTITGVFASPFVMFLFIGTIIYLMGGFSFIISNPIIWIFIIFIFGMMYWM